MAVSFRFWGPVTTPVRLMKAQGVWRLPPLQPLDSALKHTSWALKGMARVPFEAMHMRSDAAEAAPKAQQQPVFVTSSCMTTPDRAECGNTRVFSTTPHHAAPQQRPTLDRPDRPNRPDRPHSLSNRPTHRSWTGPGCR